MTKERIHNPKTGKYYQIRQRTTSEGRKGQIMGAYKNDPVKVIKQNFSRAIKRLGSK